MSNTAVLSQDQDELTEEQRAYVHSILGDGRLDPVAETDLICPRRRRTSEERSTERGMHQQHLQRKAKASKNRRARREELRPLTHLERIRLLRHGILPRDLDHRKLSRREQKKVEVILAAQQSKLEPNQTDFAPTILEEATRMPMGKVLNELEVQGRRIVSDVIDGVRVYVLDTNIGIIPAV